MTVKKRRGGLDCHAFFRYNRGEYYAGNSVLTFPVNIGDAMLIADLRDAGLPQRRD